MIVAYIDGGARGNPGPAGFGVRVEDASGGLIAEFSQSIGHATNNVAGDEGPLAGGPGAAPPQAARTGGRGGGGGGGQPRGGGLPPPIRVTSSELALGP